ncbi:MAG: protein translocase subunit SecF [Candidatus Cloacimonadota bacterium]|nr:MAG: protein translocase subunit SecF [Candidatus Cloacimonadota bacterium]
MQFFSETKIDFISKRTIAFIISGTIILIGIISLIINNGPKYSIDFLGGTLLELDFTPVDANAESIKIQDIRDVLNKYGYLGAEIQEFGNPNYILVRIKGSKIVGKQVIDILQKEFPKYTKKNMNEFLRRQEEVGPRIGEELRGKAIKAILIAMLGIIIYIWWRFELSFGIAAVIALFHDVFITIGIFSIFGREISLPVIAALLTIVGYSLNDTIVVFDRIREDLKIYRRDKFKSVINHSINETLSRTVITSLTTFVVVLSLFLFGGSVIHNFALALLIGIIVGTYSSIFVASPVLVEYYERSGKKSTLIKR